MFKNRTVNRLLSIIVALTYILVALSVFSFKVYASDVEEAEAATEKIFIDGIFGFENEENRSNTAINTARKSSYPKLLAMLGTAIRKVFPSYQTLIRSEHYAFLAGKPLLLPATWIYRIFRGIFCGKTSVGVRRVSESFASKDAYHKRDNMLNKWGL